jgi:hypothetical protein
MLCSGRSAWSQSTTSPSTVALAACVLSGMNSDCVNIPTACLKSRFEIGGE